MSRKNTNTPEGSSKRIRGLPEDEEKYRIIAENSYDWVFWIDPDGSFIYTSPSCERLTGYTREEFTNDPGLLTDIIHPEDGYAKDHLLRYNAPEKESGDIEFRIITKDGYLQWIRHSCTSVFDKNGKYAGRTGTNRNITDRKNAENALNYSHKLMSYIVEHDPSAIAIHDKDLNYIFVSKRYLHDYKVTEKDIIGKHHYDVFPDIPERWKEVHKRVLAGEVLRSDEDPFEREGGSVQFGCKFHNDELLFYVKDTGIGITRELHEEIFKRFRQANGPSSKEYGGSGLGLSIAKAYLDLLGGRIWLNSEPGKGSEFYFSIPAEKPAQTIPEPAERDNNAQISSNILTTVLIAEDEDFNFLLLEEFLTDTNINIIRACNGKEAVNICKHAHL